MDEQEIMVEDTKPKGTRDMTVGSTWRHIFFFTLPLLAGNVLQQLYSMADAIIVGQVVGQEGLAGVGTTIPVIIMITSMFVGIGLGAAVLVSQYYSKRDMESLRRLVSTVYSLLLPLIAVIVVLGLTLVDPLLKLINVPVGDTFEYSRIYITILLFGLLGSFGFNLNAGIMQAMGNSIRPFVLLSISIVLNIALDILFVFGFGWGVSGVAIATVIAQSLSWIVGMIYMNRRYPFLKLSIIRFEYHWKHLKQAVKLGLPSGLNQTLFSVGTLAMQGLVNSQGTEFIAGFSAATKIDAFAVLPIQSIAAAVTTFVAQNLGVARFDRVKKGLRVGLVISISVSALVGVLAWIFGPFLLRLFIYDENPAVVSQVVAAGQFYLSSIMPFYVLLAAMFMLHAMLRGAGQMLVPMVTTLSCLYLVRLPLANLLAGSGVPGHMFYAYAVDWAVGLLVAIAYYATGRWKKKRLVDASEVLMLGQQP